MLVLIFLKILKQFLHRGIKLWVIDILNECDLFNNFFKGVQVRNFDLSIHNNEKIITAIKGVNKINLENSLKTHDHFTEKLDKEREKILSIDHDISNIDEFFNIRKKYTELLDYYFLHYGYIEEINKAYGD